MESQRVKALTKGYLHGWLKFEYPYSTSRRREELILNHIQDEDYAQLLEQKLFVDTVVRSTSNNRTTETMAPIYDLTKKLIALKLPSLAPKATIKENKEAGTQADIAEWKDFLKKVNNK